MVNLRLKDLIPLPHKDQSASCKDVEVCAAKQSNAYPDHQASVIVTADFSDIEGQVRIPRSPLIKVWQEYEFLENGDIPRNILPVLPPPYKAGVGIKSIAIDRWITKAFRGGGPL
ncbi:hypothetical protein TNCV_4030521 [Trichonephila clavipes]|nr:hypothetical protein TNCV_4030521 [Trichonephila clavipes]